MEEIMINELTHDGMRRVKVIGDAPLSVSMYQAAVPCEARDRAKLISGGDGLLGLFSLEVTWPVYGPIMFAICGPKKFRRLMVVNFIYEERVSDCIELARIMFFAGTHFAPKYAFLLDLPNGAEDCMDVHGCILLQAEWMPARCVAVGGRDG
jgi:hypothetical protein